MEQIVATIFWLGQACFVIQTDNVTILTDPYNAKMGYAVTTVEGVDVVTISHEHGDHNNAALAAGKPVVLRGLSAGAADFNSVDQKVKDVRIHTANSFHDAAGGSKRGKNAIFIFEVPSNPPLRIVHLGDLGEPKLSDAQVKAIGAADVLFIPVGGFYTIDAAQADDVIAQLKPKIVIPMHWKTAKTPNLPVQDDTAFLKGKRNVLRDGGTVKGNRLMITASLLKKAAEAGEPLIVPLDFGPPPAPKK